MPFQKQINRQQAPAVEGDFATNNPKASYPSLEGSFIAGVGGVLVGRFAWINVDGISLSNTGIGRPDGFIAREQQGSITNYLSDSSMLIPEGLGVTLFRFGDFFALNIVDQSQIGEACFAKNSDGTIFSAVHGSVVPGYTETNFMIRRDSAAGELTIISAPNTETTVLPPSFGDRITDDDEIRDTDDNDIRIID